MNDNASEQSSVSNGAVAPATELPLGTWGYQDTPGSNRDLRLDWLRGMAMILVVVDHIRIFSAYSLFSYERVGCVSAAEAFILISGLVLGMVHRRRVDTKGWGESAKGLVNRSLQLYRVGFFLTASVLVLRKLGMVMQAHGLPWLDTACVAGWLDDQPPHVYYELIPHAGPVKLLADMLLMQFGVWQFVIMGLYVVLLGSAPLAIWLLARKRTWLMLGISWSLYVIQQAYPRSYFNAQFEDPFPLFTWQALFFSALALGYHRQAVLDWLKGWRGKTLLVACIVIAVGGMVFALCNPHPVFDDPRHFHLHLSQLPAARWKSLYWRFFSLPLLGVGRLLNSAALFVVCYTLLTRLWGPANKLLGWLLLPIGQATLYVFAVHVYVCLVQDNIAATHHNNLLLNTAVHTLAVLLIWLMVRTKFLFGWIPR